MTRFLAPKFSIPPLADKTSRDNYAEGWDRIWGKFSCDKCKKPFLDNDMLLIWPYSDKAIHEKCNRPKPKTSTKRKPKGEK